MSARTAVGMGWGARPPAWLLAVVLGALSLGCGPSQRFYVTQASLDEQLAELRPRFEQELGVQLPADLTVVNLTDRARVRERFEGALRPQLAPVAVRLFGEQGADAFVETITNTLQGHYDPADHEILVHRSHYHDSLEKTVEWQRALLLHELLHVAFDEQFGVAEFLGAAEDGDALWLRRALMEGHAAWRSRGLEDALDVDPETGLGGVVACDSGVYGPGNQLQLRATFLRLARRIGFARDGERLMAALAEQGAGAPQAVLVDPPRDLSLLYHHDPERALREQSLPLKRGLAQVVERQFDAPSWTHWPTTWLPTLLHQTLRFEGARELFDPEEDDLDRFLRRVHGVAGRDGASADQSQWYELAAFELASATDAQRLAEFFEQKDRQDEESLERSRQLPLGPERARIADDSDKGYTLRGVRRFEGWTTRDPVTGAQSAIDDLPFLWATFVRGARVLRLEAWGLDLSPEELQRRADEIFSAIDAAAADSDAP